MAGPDSPTPPASPEKVEAWLAAGQKISKETLRFAFLGAGAIAAIALLSLVVGQPILSSVRQAIPSVGVILASLAGIGFLITSARRSRRDLESQLREGEAAFAQAQLVLNATSEGVFVTDERGRIQAANRAAIDLFRFPEAKIIGQKLSSLIADSDPLGDRTNLPRTMLANGVRGSRKFPIELRLSELPGESGRLFMAFVRDMSMRELASTALNHSAAGLRSQPGSKPIRSLLKELANALGTRRAFLIEMLGEGASALAMRTVSEDGDLRGTAEMNLRDSVCGEVLSKGFRLISSGARQQFPGDVLLSEHGSDAFAAMPLNDNRGRVLGVIGVLHEQRFDEESLIECTLQIFASRAASEIERKRFEEGIAAEKERLAVTLRSIGDACITVDNDGRVVMFNAVAERLTGWLHDDATGHLVHEVVHLLDERTRRRSQQLIQRLVTSDPTATAPSLHIIVSRDGDECTVESSSAPIRDRRGCKLGGIIVLRDVTAQRQAEAERQKTEKLESLGLVAGGIAHDFNNLLTMILGNVTLALGHDSLPATLNERLDGARKASQRAQELAGQLLTFAKGGAPVKQPAHLGKLLVDTVRCAITASHTTCDTQIAPDLWPVEIDHGQMAQVIANLTTNAEQAMPSGGSIVVTAENLALAVDSLALGLRAGRWVHFSIEDHGVGIPEPYLKKIFDPYFTTKATGSGLGLATAYSIVKNHGGVLHVDSTPGEGSTFSIYLPASEKNVVPVKQEAPPEQAPPGGGRVLVLDDEEAICMLVTCALEPLGYEVTETQDGTVALQKYEEAMKSGRKYDLVISDLTMPGRMSGHEAIRRLRELDPDVRAIVSSGYANDPVMSRFEEYGFCGMIAKPYEIDALGRKVAEVMAKGPAPAPTSVIYHSFVARKTA